MVIHSWFGLINQVSYAFSMTDCMLPFREFLKPGTAFRWDARLDTLLEGSKMTIVQEIKKCVTIFNKSRPTCLATDWSKTGIGFTLFQKHCDCPKVELHCCCSGWKVVLVGSRFTHSAESRYAPVEGEDLAVVDALDKARYFVLGCENLIVAVDHKPLLKLFGDRSLNDIPNPRLRNLKEKTLWYRFRMVHVPSTSHKKTNKQTKKRTHCPVTQVETFIQPRCFWLIARAESSVFWPGITPTIAHIRERCSHCNRMAPSQPSAPPVEPIPPVYPFQSICADYFHYKGTYYLVIVDWYSNWPTVEQTSGGATGLVTCLRHCFVTYGIPDELSTDGGPEFVAALT